MGTLPKPLLGLLLATVVAFVLWTVALKPGASSGGSPNAGTYQSAIAKAHQASALSGRANAANGAPVGTSTAPAATSTAPAGSTRAAPAAHSAPATPASAQSQSSQSKSNQSTSAQGKSGQSKPNATPKPAAKPALAVSQRSVLAAINAHKVVGVLFYNPSAPDDTAVQQQLARVGTDHGQVATFAVPISQLTNFGALTAKVPVNQTPTLIIIDRQGEARSLVGFLDQREISQRIADGLANH